LQQMEPCGQENEPPVFLSRGLSVVQAQTVGNEGRHLKLELGGDGQVRDAIAFRQGERLAELSDRVDVVYCLEVNEWNGERRLQLNVQDIKPAKK
jgi:single-stranded-DNA-specific exonuclease